MVKDQDTDEHAISVEAWLSVARTAASRDELVSALDELDDKQLFSLERNIKGVVGAAFARAESVEPGALANRIVEQIDERPMRALRLPAQLTGGKDILDISGGDTRHRLATYWWPKIREEVRASIARYFRGLIAAREAEPPPRSREQRIRIIVRALRFVETMKPARTLN